MMEPCSIPNNPAGPGWLGGRTRGRTGWAGLGWGAWAGPAPAQAPVPETPTPTAVHPALVPSWAGKGGGLYGEQAEPGNGSPGCPQPRSPAAAPGSSVWVQHGESGAKTRRKEWDTGRFPGSPSSVLQINNPRLQRPPRAPPGSDRPLSLQALPFPGHSPRPRAPPPVSRRGCGTSELCSFVTEKANPRGGGVAGRLAGGRLEAAPAFRLALSEKRAGPLLTMRCGDPTTFQSLRPRPGPSPPHVRLRPPSLLGHTPSPASQGHSKAHVSLLCTGVFLSGYLYPLTVEWLRPSGSQASLRHKSGRTRMREASGSCFTSCLALELWPLRSA